MYFIILIKSIYFYTLYNSTVGGNAEFTINGTEYTATSNIVTSDITKIKGVTLNLKNVSKGEPVTVTIEKDGESVANAVQDIVDGYNQLIENVDKEIAQDGNLHDQTTLKLIRNQIRNLMMNSTGNSTFKTMSSIGISTESAS